MDMVNGAAALTLMVMVNANKFNQMRPLTIPPPIENSVYRSTALPLCQGGGPAILPGKNKIASTRLGGV